MKNFDQIIVGEMQETEPIQFWLLFFINRRNQAFFVEITNHTKNRR